MEIKEKKHPTLEEIVHDSDEIRPHIEKEDTHIYVPDHPYLLSNIKNYWYSAMNKIGPISAEFTRYAPGGEINYVLWKMPPKLHKLVNKILDYATMVLREYQPEGAVYTGLLSAASKIIYGIKTRSGESLLSGLVGSLGHLKQIDSPKLKELYDESMPLIEKYFKPFKKARIA